MKRWQRMTAVLLALILACTGLAAAEGIEGLKDELPEDVLEVVARFVGLCLLRGDKTADLSLHYEMPEDEFAVPYFTPVEGAMLSILLGDTPTYFLAVTDQERIDVQREETLYTDFIRALNPDISEEDAAGISALLMDVDPFFDNLEGMSVGYDPWWYQYMRSPDPEVTPPTLYVMPLSSREEWPIPSGETQPLTFDEAEEAVDDLYAEFRALCKENGLRVDPETPAEADSSDPSILCMTRIALDTAEWSSVYTDEYLVAFSLCVHKGTLAYADVEDLMAVTAVALIQDGTTVDDMRTQLKEVYTGLEDDGTGLRINSAEHGDYTLSISEDHIRRLLLVIIPAEPVQDIPWHSTPNAELVEAEDAAYTAFFDLCKANGLAPTTGEPETTLEGTTEFISYLILDGVEWTLMYQGDTLVGFMLAISEEDSAGPDMLMFEWFVSAAFGLDADAAHAAFTEAAEATAASTTSFSLVPVEGEQFSGVASYSTWDGGYSLVVFPPFDETGL